MRWRMLIALIAATLLLGLGSPRPSSLDEIDEKSSQLTIPWDEFKKLLNLDEDDIVLSLETFQKLLAQTGITTTPPHTLKGGDVILTRAEFNKLVEQMKPPARLPIQPPFDYLITKANYTGSMQDDNTSFTGNFSVHVLRKDAYLKIPLLPQSIALRDIKVDGKGALVVSEAGYHTVVLSEVGEHDVTASFSLKSSLEKGPHKIDLAIQRTPITLFQLELPLRDIDVEIPQAQQIITTVRGNATLVSAIITPGQSISVRWRKKVEALEKVAPKLYCEVHHLVSIDDDALRMNSDLNYNILHSEVNEVRLAIPEDINVLSVSGEGVGAEWRETVQQGQRLILIPFTYGKKGAVTVRVSAEKALSETGLANLFSGIRVLDTVRETGFVGVELNTSAEVIVTESEGLEEIAIQKLPQPLINKSAKPLILGFKYLKHPFGLVLDIKKHEKIAVPVATINSANVVTLCTEDGKIVHRLVYQVRNTAKQFLEIELPETADVWSVFVGHQPVESSINAQGKLLVPLIRSRSVDNRLDTFPIEVIYCLVEESFSAFGRRASSLPSVDLMISQLMWSVYLPNDYSYHYFSSTLEKEEIIRGINVFAGAKRQYDEEAMKEVAALPPGEYDEMRRDKLEQVYKGKDYKSQFRNIPMQEEQISSQLDAELEFGGRLEGLTQTGIVAPSVSGPGATGILPIQIQVPVGGQVYRFARTIVKTEDPLTFSVIYTRLWVITLFKWLIIILIIAILLLFRERLRGLWAWLRDKSHVLAESSKKHQGSMTRIAQSIITPIVLLGLVVIFWRISRFFKLLFLFLFFISVIYHLLLQRQRRAQIEAKLDGDIEGQG